MNDTNVSFNIEGTITTNGKGITIKPNICPGCGRCKDCGQPYPQFVPYIQPYQPYIRPTPWNPTIVWC